MGVAIDTVVGSATNPGAGPVAVAFASGDSGVVRNARAGSATLLEHVWRNGAAAGLARVRSPLLHDFVQGLRFRGLAGDPSPLTPHDFQQPLQPQDTLTVEVGGGAAETDSVGLQIYYSDLPGADAILKMPGDVVPIVEQFIVQEVACVASATIGAWSDTAVNASFDNFKGNRWYCVLGYEVDVPVTAVAIKGPATSNLRVGGPGMVTRIESRRWFLWNAEASGHPYIPVFNSADKGGTVVSVNDKAASTAVNVSLILGLLPVTWTP